jgi:hypothetical protein
MRKSDRRYLHRAVGHPLAQDIPQVLSEARLTADAKLVYLALLSLADPSGHVCATMQEIAERTAAIQDEIEGGDAGLCALGGAATPFPPGWSVN